MNNNKMMILEMTCEYKKRQFKIRHHSSYSILDIFIDSLLPKNIENIISIKPFSHQKSKKMNVMSFKLINKDIKKREKLSLRLINEINYIISSQLKDN